MPRSFSPAIAEQVVDSVEAVVVAGGGVGTAFVAKIADLPEARAEAACELAEDLGLLYSEDGLYSLENPLGKFLVTPHEPQKAAVIRVILETYPPFLKFRERLESTGQVTQAARQTKALLELEAHPEEVKETLVNLGTYAQALVTRGGGRYESASDASDGPLEALVQLVEGVAQATRLVRRRLGPDAVNVVSEDEVIAGLADAFLKAQGADPDGAVFEAGNAIESYLTRFGERQGVDFESASGINAKLDRLQQEGALPKKLKHFGKYLGHVRNAADHGVDPDIDAEWSIADNTGLEFVFVACSFIAAVTRYEAGGPRLL